MNGIRITMTDGVVYDFDVFDKSELMDLYDVMLKNKFVLINMHILRSDMIKSISPL